MLIYLIVCLRVHLEFNFFCHTIIFIHIKWTAIKKFLALFDTFPLV